MRPEKLTKVQIKILACLNLHGGQLKSLNRLAEGVKINYSWAWVLVNRLEADGLVSINRSGRDLVINTIHQSGKPTDLVG
jgi:DNA-binding MarR family transcriptional regulator